MVDCFYKNQNQSELDILTTTLHVYEKDSGAILNHNKSEIVWIGGEIKR